jgi:hypothetical protein
VSARSVSLSDLYVLADGRQSIGWVMLDQALRSFQYRALEAVGVRISKAFCQLPPKPRKISMLPRRAVAKRYRLRIKRNDWSINVPEDTSMHIAMAVAFAAILFSRSFGRWRANVWIKTIESRLKQQNSPSN